MTLMLLIARLVLAAVFGVAGFAKLADLAGSRRSIGEFGVPAFLVPSFAILLPLFELTCAVALFRTTWARWGAIGSFALLLLFVVAIAVSLVRGRRPDCHCFGQLHSSPVGWTTLFRNAVLAGVASFIVLQGAVVPQVSVLPDLVLSGERSNSLVLFLLLVVAAQAIAGLGAIYYLLRQSGRMLLRLEAIEAKLGVEAAPQLPPAGLPVGSVSPDFSLRDLDGGTVTLGQLRAGGKPLLLFFSDADCSACDTVLPDVARWQREHADRLLVVTICGGDVDTSREKSRTHGVQHVLLEVDSEVAKHYDVTATPSAVLVTDGQIASPLAVGPDAIRSLVSRATTPPPLKKGDRVPSLPLRDLNGATTDLAAIAGRRTLLLFWNPSCGFCQQMLDDVKAWESSRSDDAPHLLVIAAGSPKANREQGFRAQVLLDPKFGASRVFGAGGTQAGVLVNENGRVASDVGVGASEVLALLGAVPTFVTR